LKNFLKYLAALIVLTALCVAGGLYWTVVLEPGEEIEIENIRRILGKESHVFYSDGKTRLGVFFDTAHRQYVAYDEIPEVFVNALVASEDDRFFEHIGFDIIGITRALIKNLQAGRVVQGGSTLTQQTVKNLFRRSERSFEAKFKELLFALRLEHRYSKEQIFEFYVNQFYVSGNGHGLGVAARYYFDKKPSDLTLVESAFIAGSVKRPNYYNPFIKKSKKASDIAITRAKIRLKYVLGKMQTLGMIDNFSYSEAISSEIAFKQGKVGFSLDYAMDMVKDAVSSTEVLNGLAVHGITNVATSGVRIVTTVDKELQKKTLAILRRELSRLDVRMRGYSRDEVQDELTTLQYQGDNVLQEDAFLFGTIDSIEGEEKKIKLTVSFGHKVGTGIIDYTGLQRLSKARAKWQKGLWSEPDPEDLGLLLGELQVEDRVWVSVRQQVDDATALLSLERYPKVQGGALVLKDGLIKGMAGGTENRFYNRAVYAKRTMGSAFKPYVYTSALQLGWNSADLLKNSRDVFVYHDQPYFPRPDHRSPYEWVSMSWAGVHSENVASVWLTSHLCDRLTGIQFKEVSDYLGLSPKVVNGEDEPYRAYKARIRDRYGIVVNRDVLRAAAYREAVVNLETDFIFEGMSDEYRALKKLHYGLHFDKFKEKIQKELNQKRSTLREYEIREIELRKAILSKSYLSFMQLREAFRRYVLELESGRQPDEYDPFTPPAAALFSNPLTGAFSFHMNDDQTDNLTAVTQQQMYTYLSPLDDIGRDQFWQKVKLGALVSAEAFDMLSKQLDFEYEKLNNDLPYSFSTLAKVDDFRIMVGLHYLVKFARELHIDSTLEPVLSFPLGSNVVTLLESTRMYEALVTGKVTSFVDAEEEENIDSLAIIDRIESAEGKILYQPQPERKTLIDDKTRLAIGHILENVVKFGTGRKADAEVRLSGGGKTETKEIVALDLKIPLLGKTGTANRYTNASFFGYLPGLSKNSDALTIENGYAVGVYVGFDDNTAMRKKSTRISGSAGALPSWIDIVNVLMVEKGYASSLDPVDLSFNGLILKRDELGQVNAAVDPERGGLVDEPLEEVSVLSRYQPSIVTFGKKTQDGRLDPLRYFQPFWKVEEKKQ
jgi:penicillin-binding protein 1A